MSLYFIGDGHVSRGKTPRQDVMSWKSSMFAGAKIPRYIFEQSPARILF